MALKTCRCCCATIRLEQAAKIIGILFTILGAISIVSNGVQLLQLDANRDTLLAELAKLLPPDDVEPAFQRMRTMMVIALCYGMITTLYSALLTAGAYRRNKQLVLASFVLNVLCLTAQTIFCFYVFYDPSTVFTNAEMIRLQKQDENVIKIAVYVGMAVALSVLAFLWYLAIVVYSYYKELVKSGPTYGRP